MKKLVVGNWKLHPSTISEAQRLARFIVPAVRRGRADVVVCPPAPFIGPLRAKFPELTFGAQDAFFMQEGAYTGAVGPAMLKSVGVQFIIAGHSERRAVFHETDIDIAQKVRAISDNKLTAILCVGEPLVVRKKGIAASRRFVAEQLKKALKGISDSKRLVIAYEPVWAISTSGSGKNETVDDAVEMIRFIKKLHPGRVLYGGSVNAKNAFDFLSRNEIGGVLVGGASIRSVEFRIIIESVS